jgi:hypothetical protein
MSDEEIIKAIEEPANKLGVHIKLSYVCPAQINLPFPRKALDRLGCVKTEYEKRQVSNHGWPDKGWAGMAEYARCTLNGIFAAFLSHVASTARRIPLRTFGCNSKCAG